MGVLETVLREIVGAYLPFVDEKLIHIDILGGVCQVSDLDYEPNPVPVHFLAALPLELTRIKVRDLEVGLSWRGGPDVRFGANGIEIWLREREWGCAVEEVVRSARFKGKKRKLAEGERAAAANWMDSLIPGILDSVSLEVNCVRVSVELSSGVSFSLNIEALRTNIPPGSFDLSLEKELKAEKLSVTTNIGDESDVVLVRPLSFSAKLRYSKGLLDADFSFLDDISVELDVALMRHLHLIIERAQNWERAILYNRPLRQAFKSHPERWWRYAVRCISRCSEKLAETKALSMIRNCKKYTELHVRRLRNISPLSEKEEETIVELEYLFDADMILLLRMNARKEVRAEEALQFAREGWLSWLLFGTEASSSRERVKKDVFKAFQALDMSKDANRAGSRDKLFFRHTRSAANWSRALFKVFIPQVNLSIAHKGSIVDFLAYNLKLSYQYDSALYTTLLTLSLGNAKVTNETSVLITRSEDHRGKANGFRRNGHQHGDSVLNPLFCCKIQSQPEVGGVVKAVSLFVAPLRFYVDLPKLLPVAMAVKRVLQIAKMLSSDVSDYQVKGTTGPAAAANITTQISLGAEFIQFVFPRPELLRRQRGKDGVIVTFADVELQTPVAIQSPRFSSAKVEGRLSLSISRLICDLEGGLTKSKVPLSSYVSPPAQNFVVQTGVHVEIIGKGRITCELEDVAVEIHESDLRLLLTIWKEVENVLDACEQSLAQVDNDERNLPSGNPPKRNAVRPVPSDLGGPRFSLDAGIKVLKLSIFKEVSRRKLLAVLHLRGVALECATGILERPVALGVRLESATLKEMQHGGSLRIMPEPEGRGLEITLGGNVDIKFGTICGDLTPDSLNVLAAYCVDMFYIGARTSTDEDIINADTEATAIKTDVRVYSISAYSTKLGWKISTTSIEFMALNLQAKVLSGHVKCEMDMRHIVDRSRKSGYHSKIVLPRRQGRKVHNLCPKLLIQYGPESLLHIFMKDLQLCVFRHIVRDVSNVIISISDLVQGIYQRISQISSIGGHCDFVGEVELQERSSEQSDDADSDFTTIVKGEDLIISIPGSISECRAAGIICSSGKVLVRKSSTLIEFRGSSIASTENSVTAKDTDWSIILPNVSVDIFHSKRTILHDAHDVDDPDFNVVGATRLLSTWTVSVLNDVSLLLLRSQLRIIQAALLDNLLYRDRNGEVSQEEKGATAEQSSGKEGPGPKSTRTILKVSTQDILVELLNDKPHRSGLTVEGLASFCIGPVSYRRDRLEHVSQLEQVTVVDRSLMEGTSLCIYNTQRSAPEPCRLVVDMHLPDGDMVAIKAWSLMRIDPGCRAATQVEVQLAHPWIMATPSLYQKIWAFLVAEGKSERLSNSHLLSHRQKDVDSEVPVIKVNLSVKYPQIFIPERTTAARSRALRILLCDGATASLFFGSNRSIQTHSVLKLRGMVVSICSPVRSLKEEMRNSAATLAVGGKYGNGLSDNTRVILDAIGKIAYLRRWATSLWNVGTSCSLLSIPLATVRMSPHIAINIPTVIGRLMLAHLPEVTAVLTKLDLPSGRESTSCPSSAQPFTLNIEKLCILAGSLRCVAKVHYTAGVRPTRQQCNLGFSLDTRTVSSAQHEQIVSRCDLVVTNSGTDYRNVFPSESLTNVQVERLAVAISPNGVAALAELFAVLRNLPADLDAATSDNFSRSNPALGGFLPSKTILANLRNVTLSALSLGPIREVLRLTMNDVKVVLDLVESRRVCRLVLRKTYMEDLIAYRRARSEMTPASNPFVIVLNSGSQYCADGARRNAYVTTEEVTDDYWNSGPPAFRAAISWNGRFDDATIDLSLAPIDLGFDSRSLPEITRCFSELLRSVQRLLLHKRVARTLLLPVPRVRSSGGAMLVKSLRISSFHVRLGAHGPNTNMISDESLQNGVLSYIKNYVRRGLVWIFGSEEVHGLRLSFPSITLRDCESNSMMHRIVREYYRFISGFSFAKQFLLQPRLTLQLSGVGLLTYLSVPQLLPTSNTAALLEDDKDRVLKLLDWNERDEVAVSSDSEAESYGSATETLDLTSFSVSSDQRLFTLAGINFFERPGEGFKLLGDFRSNPLTKMNDDRYILYTVPEERVGILVTSKRILKIDRMNEDVLRGVPLKDVVDCVAEEDVVVIHYLHSDERSVAVPFSDRLKFSPLSDSKCRTLDLKCFERSVAVWLGDCINRTRSNI